MQRDGVDLGRRLVGFGVFAVATGVGFVVLGVLYLALPLVAPALLEEASTDYAAILMGFLLFVMLGAVMIWAGIGSMRKRRWVRPIMLFISGTWLIVGGFWLLFVLSMLDDLPYLAGAQILREEPLVGTLVQVFLVGTALVGGMALPAAFLWAYRHPGIQATCERHDAQPTWSDRCPGSILGLSAALVAAAVFSLPMLIRPIAPLFGWLVTGWPAGVALLAGAVLCLWLAVSVFRLEPIGWWSTLAFLILLGVSFAWTFVGIDPIEIYRKMGYPEQQLALLERSGIMGRAAMLVGTAGFTVAGVAYMLAVRRHFRGGTANTGQT